MAGSMLIYWRVYLHMWWIQLILKSHVITHKIPFHSYKEWLDICSVASDPWPMMMSSVIRWFQRRGWDPSVFHQQTGVQHMFGSIFVNYIRLYNRFFLNCSSPFFACFFPEFLLMCRRLCRARCVGCGPSLAWFCGPFYHFSYAWAFLGDDKSVPMKSGGHCVFPCICYAWTNPTRWHTYIYI